MKNIILQHFDGDLRPLDLLSIDNISNYAKTIGVEYRLVQGRPFREHLTSPCQKVYMLNDEWDDYDDVLMLDIDMFAPKDMSEDIFDQTGVGLYNPIQYQLHMRLVHNHPDLANVYAPYWGGAIYKMGRKLRRALRNGLGGDERWMLKFNTPYYYEDEGIMHVLANRAGVITNGTHLDPKWCQCNFLPHPEMAGFIHIRTKVTPNGPKRDKMENYQELVGRGIL